MLKLSQSIMASHVFRSVVVLTSGRALAIVVPLLTAPILGRLYTPADYGPLASFLAISGLFGILSVLQYQQAIFVETDDDEAEAMVSTCLALGCVMTGISVLIAIALFLWLQGRPAFSGLQYWVFSLPVTTFLSAFAVTISAFAGREKKFRRLAKIPVLTAVITAAVSITLGALNFRSHGLLIAYFAGHIFAFMALYSIYRSLMTAPFKIHYNAFKTRLSKHRRYAVFTFPSAAQRSLTSAAAVYALTYLGSMPVLGAYSRANQLVSLPVGFLASSVGQVFQQQGAEDYRETGSCRTLYLKTCLSMGLLCLPIMAVLYFLAPKFFEIYMGPNWIEAGYIVRILIPLMLTKFVLIPVLSVFSFAKKQQLEFTLSTASMAVTLVSVIVPIALGLSPKSILYAFSAALSLSNIAFLIAGYWVTVNRGTATV